MKKYPLLILLMTLSGGASAANNVNIDTKKDLYVHGIVCGTAGNKQSFRPKVVFTNTGKIEHGTYHFVSNYGPYSYTFKAHSAGLDAVLSRVTTTKDKQIEDVCIVKKYKDIPPILGQYVNVDKLAANDPKRDGTLNNLKLVSGMPVNK